MKQWLLGAMTLGILTACSSEDMGTNGADSDKTLSTGNGFIAMHINLPTQQGTRAANDNYDDGTPEEYNVRTIHLALFAGTDEATATFKGVYPMNDYLTSDPGTPDDNITTSYTKVARISNFAYSATDKLYALALVNIASVAGVIPNDDNTLTLDGASFTGTFTDLLNATAVTDNATNGFFMTNAPVVDAKAGGLNGTAATVADVRTLTEFNQHAIYETEAEAKAHPAASIFVERSVAKIEVNVSSTTGSLKDNQGNDMVIDDVKWAVDNTERSSYIVRNMGIGATGAADYMGYTSSLLAAPNRRMAGSVAIGTTSLQPLTSLYRTYWCVDPNYSTDAPGLNTTTTPAFGKQSINYVHENTFDVKHQDYRNTTRVVFEVTLNGGQAFYTVNEDNKIYRTLADAEKLIKKTLLETEAVKQCFINALNDPAAGSSIQTQINENNITLTYANALEEGNVKVLNGIKLSVDQALVGTDKLYSKQPTLEAIEASMVIQMNTNYTIVEYSGGKTYYDVRLMHFGSPAVGGDWAQSDLTPWYWTKHPETTENIQTTDKAYGNPANAAEGATSAYALQNYLGRYGLVRNNWYELNVSAFRKLGSPTVPDVTLDKNNKSDDNIENDKYVSFTINVLSWAKRTQNVEF